MSAGAATAPGGMVEAGANPFSLRAVLALVLFGAAVFVALLWMVGSGMGGGSVNDGGDHAGSKGLAGYAAFAELLEMQGREVRLLRNETDFDRPGLLVLTPPAHAGAEAIAEAMQKHRYDGPTLVILPKWHSIPIPAQMRSGDVKAGWVQLGPPVPIQWDGDVPLLGDLDLATGKSSDSAARWKGFGLSGRLPDAKAVQSMSSGRMVALVEDGMGQALAGYIDDGSDHGLLSAAAQGQPSRVRGSRSYPVVVVAEPDLVNNYGFARQENALLALALVNAALDGEDTPVLFDMTLPGHGRSTNLLTLAFTPPFLAATLCLLMAMVAVGWRAFIRFGAAAKAQRAIAFGKRALVANAAGLVRRSGRLHLIGGPYADRSRERLARALALSRHADPRETEAAIDTALARRAPEARPFSRIAAALRAARGPHELLRAARELHALERMLIR